MKSDNGKMDTAQEKPSEKDKETEKQISTGEIGGPSGPEPTRYGDWERKGRCVDF